VGEEGREVERGGLAIWGGCSSRVEGDVGTHVTSATSLHSEGTVRYLRRINMQKASDSTHML
jgi:hypothetical protein